MPPLLVQHALLEAGSLVCIRVPTSLTVLARMSIKLPAPLFTEEEVPAEGGIGLAYTQHTPQRPACLAPNQFFPVPHSRWVSGKEKDGWERG